MGLLNLFNKKPSVVWRDKSGNLFCKGDNCPQKCDKTCPIWCQTMALTLVKMGHSDKAIEELKKAVALAPDFKAAWVNLAAIYGGLNKHMEANKAYKTAYELDNKYPNAILGIIISFKNLGQYNEALKYCDKYESLVGKIEADKLRHQIKNAQNPNNKKEGNKVLDMTTKILSEAHELDLIDIEQSFPNIPEIVVAGKTVCHKILQDLIKQEDGKNPKIWLAWGAYAGIGAVHHWNINWNELKKNGIAETLLKPRGSFAMDEYVLDSIGIGFETEDGKTFSQGIYNLSTWAFREFLVGNHGDNPMQEAEETMYAMYLFGMVFQMIRLGMK